MPVNQPSIDPSVRTAHVLQGYRLYRITLLLAYAMFIGLGSFAFFSELAPERGGPRMGITVALIGVVMAGLVLASFRIPRRPWAWNAHMVLICLGVPLIVTTPFALTLGYQWLDPTIKTYFGHTDEDPTP